MGFLVCTANGVRLLNTSYASPFERIVEMIPQALEELRGMGEEEKVPRVNAAYQDS